VRATQPGVPAVQPGEPEATQDRRAPAVTPAAGVRPAEPPPRPPDRATGPVRTQPAPPAPRPATSRESQQVAVLAQPGPHPHGHGAPGAPARPAAARDSQRVTQAGQPAQPVHSGAPGPRPAAPTPAAPAPVATSGSGRAQTGYPRTTPPTGAVSRRRHTDPASDSFGIRGVRSPLVGREAELASMLELLQQAVDFQAPQILTITGNQGTGKSRLAAELIERYLARAGHGIRVYHGHAEKGGPRFGAVASLLRDRFGLREGDTSEAAIARFRTEVAAVFGDERIVEMLHFLGSFLEFHFPDSPLLRVFAESRTQHDEIARTVLRRFIEVDAEKGPLVLVLDDLQWADDDTLELFRDLGSRLGGAPVVLIACARPEMLVRCPEWGTGSADHRRFELRNLGPDHAYEMLQNLLSRCDGVPEEVIEDAVEMTGGNPYFLEQLVRLFLDNGTIEVSGVSWRLDPDKAAETELPISIEEAIQARVAALAPDERELLEKGAVFGNVFWLGAAVALARIETHRPTRPRTEVSPVPGELAYTWTSKDDPVRVRLERAAVELAERDFVLQLDVADSTIPGEVELVFKHNLERELIIKGTESRKLARYHRLAAQWLETKLAGRSEEQLEFLGQLYERGGDHRRAAHCYLAGGDKARTRFANQEAVDLYTRGLAMLDPDDGLAKLMALHNLGDVLERVGNTADALARFREMLAVAWLFDNPAKAGAAHDRLGRIYRRQGEYDEAMAHLGRARDLFERSGDERGFAATLDDIGQVYWLRGSYGEALTHYRRALDIRRRLSDRRSVALSLANIGRVHCDSGNFKEAIAHFRESLDLRRDIRDLSGVVQSLCALGDVHVEDQSYDVALPLFEEAHRIALDIGDKLAQAEVLSHLGECKSAMDRGEEAVQNLRRAIELATGLGDRVALSECYRRLAEVHLRLGKAEDAHDEAARALHISQVVGSRVHAGHAHRVIAEALSERAGSPEDQTEAEKHFEKAIEILGGMQNQLDLARAYRGFATFRERNGMSGEAAKLRRQADAIYSRLRGAAALG
jgi:tetratricopeptide (TPR) repeat protein